MKIQSLSLDAANGPCINNCKFCVGHMHDSPYTRQLNIHNPNYDVYRQDFRRRLAFARDNGCNTVMLTGSVEPQQNRQFLEMFAEENSRLASPFRWVEMQTTGTLLDTEYLNALRGRIGVSTISISISSLESEKNAEICGMKRPVELQKLCREIKRCDFNLRLSVNLTDEFDDMEPSLLMKALRNTFMADQVTFRVLYSSGEDTPQGKWIAEHAAKAETVDAIQRYVLENGRVLEQLEYGAMKYSVMGMSTVLDRDCMAKAEGKDELKYLILRPNCKLYSKWDDPASLIF